MKQPHLELSRPTTITIPSDSAQELLAYPTFPPLATLPESSSLIPCKCNFNILQRHRNCEALGDTCPLRFRNKQKGAFFVSVCAPLLNEQSALQVSSLPSLDGSYGPCHPPEGRVGTIVLQIQRSPWLIRFTSERSSYNGSTYAEKTCCKFCTKD